MWGDQDDADSISAVHASLDAGINFFDTAEGYGAGKSEDVLGEALKGRRDQAVIVTKVGDSHLSPDNVRKSCESSRFYWFTNSPSYLRGSFWVYHNGSVPLFE